MPSAAKNVGVVLHLVGAPARAPLRRHAEGRRERLVTLFRVLGNGWERYVPSEHIDHWLGEVDAVPAGVSVHFEAPTSVAGAVPRALGAAALT